MKKGGEFTPAQKAKFFCEGRATCALTGKSLWILDYGATPFWDYDWADHIKPRSRGGKATDDNGVCTSSEVNSKKSNNTRDKNYPFRSSANTGDLKLTYHFCYQHGPLIAGLREQLLRLSVLQPRDWHFNRALAQVFFGFNIRMDGRTGKRTEFGHLKSAWKFLESYRKKAEGVASFEKRGLVKRKVTTDVRLMLDLRAASSLNDLKSRVELLYPYYEPACTVLYDYIKAKSSLVRLRIEARAKKNKFVNKLVIDALKSYDVAFMPVFDAAEM